MKNNYIIYYENKNTYVWFLVINIREIKNVKKKLTIKVLVKHFLLFQVVELIF